MMNASGPQAFGESGAGALFDYKEFFTKPQVILRLISMLFSLVVFSCILSQVWEKDICTFNNSSSTCGYGTFVSVMAFIIAAVFIMVDYVFTKISNIIRRKHIVIADIIISVVWCFFYFSSFCNLVDKWRHTDAKYVYSPDACRATIVFTFFSIPCFVGLAYLAIQRYRVGVSDLTSAYSGPNSDSYDQGFTP